MSFTRNFIDSKRGSINDIKTHLGDVSVHAVKQYWIFVCVLVEEDGSKDSIDNKYDDNEDKLADDGDTVEDDTEEGIDLKHDIMTIMIIRIVLKVVQW